MEDIGIVIKVEGVMAKVLVEKKDMCEDCAGNEACRPTDRGMEIEALNSIRAEVGQKVKVSTRPYAYLKGAALFYGLPMVLFIAGAVAGKILADDYMPGMNSDLAAALAGFSVLVLSLAVIRSWGRKSESRTVYKPYIEEIISR